MASTALTALARLYNQQSTAPVLVCRRLALRAFASEPPLQRERWLIKKEYTRVRQLVAIPENDMVSKLTTQVRAYVKWFQKSGVEPFFHRKSERVVLALLHIEHHGSSEYVRGINSEVSLPTGTICAERAAIVNARAKFSGLRREHMKGIAVVEVPGPFREADDHALQNPLPPCGACREWLEKIQVESHGFYVLTYSDLSLSEVHERFLFWSIDEDTTQPKDMGPWCCCKCGSVNVPLSANCSRCGVSRFSLSYLRAPTQPRFINVLRLLEEWGQLTKDQILALLKEDGEVDQETLTKTLRRLERNTQEDLWTGEPFGRLIFHHSNTGLYSISDTGRRLLENCRTPARHKAE